MKLWKTLWRDERAFVGSAELILIATIACIGLIVGLVTYRDSVVQELGDTGAAINALNQSYAVAIQANPAAGITVSAGGTVTITSSFGDVDGNTATTGDPRVVIVTSFANFLYTDQPDLCETTAQTPGTAPAGISFGGATNIEEGTALP